MRQRQLTARTYHQVLKLSRAITDLEGTDALTQVHMAEALQNRSKLELMQLISTYIAGFLKDRRL